MRFKPYGLSFREKTRFFRSLPAGRRAAASRFAFFKGNTEGPPQGAASDDGRLPSCKGAPRS